MIILDNKLYQKELHTFIKYQGYLLKKYEKGYVVIYKDEILDVYKNRKNTKKEGYEKYGDVPFLVRNISNYVGTNMN